MNRKDGKPRKRWFKPNESYDLGEFTFLRILRKGKYIEFKIDKSVKDEVLNHRWYYCNGYCYTKSRFLKCLLHHFVLGNPNTNQKHAVVDHIDRDKTNNTIKNLRIVSQKENILNTGRDGHGKNKFQSLPKGVSLMKPEQAKKIYCKKPYRAYITSRGKHIWMQNFVSLEEAVNARLQKELQIYGKINT